MKYGLVLVTTVLLLAPVPSFATKISPAPNPAPDPQSICDGIAGNQVANCGFETGDFTSWTQSGNTGATFVDNGTTINPNTGVFAAALGPVGSDGFLTQVLSDAAGGYDLQFWLFSDGATPNDFTAYWNGVAVFSATDIPSQPYTLIDIPGLVGVGNDTLSFGFRNDPSWLGLDDISVTSTVPEPASILLLSTGLLGGGLLRRRRRKS